MRHFGGAEVVEAADSEDIEDMRLRVVSANLLQPGDDGPKQDAVVGELN
jgi:hypothetical protein